MHSLGKLDGRETYRQRADVVRGCQFCTQIVKGTPAGFPVPESFRLYDMFHTRCTRCLKACKTEPALCAFCAHLRFRHLTVCYRPEEPIQVPLGRVEDLENRLTSGCPLCCMVSHAARTMDRRFERSTRIRMEFRLLKVHKLQVWNSYTGEDHQAAYCFLSGIWPDFATLSVTNLDSIALDYRHSLGLVPLASKIGDWSPINECLAHCFGNHGRCTPPAAVMPKSFRVIDVNTRQLVDAPPDCRYVALSYVWGAEPTSSLLLTTKTTISSYKQVGGLAASKMPLTIEDAMHVCAQLELRFLWTDRLCIVQDDPSDLGEQIQAMSGIYSSAYFVIIGADGDHMSTGLAGVSQRREEQMHNHIEGLLVALAPLGYVKAIQRSIWYTRGWTYQEAILAKRKLYFTTSQVYFECETEVRHEDPLGFGLGNFNKINPDHQSPAFTMGLLGGRHVPFGEYTRHLLAFRDRHLSHQTDVFNAFAGILNALYDRNDISYGLPLPDFDQALLWRCHGSTSSLPTILHSINKPAVMHIPSWSWGSIVGNLYLESDEFQGPLVAWLLYSSDDAGLKQIKPWNAPLAWAEQEVRYANRHISGRVSMAVAWMEGCLDPPPLDIPSWKEISFVDLDQLLTSRWPTYRDFHEEAFGRGLDEDTSTSAMDLQPSDQVTPAATTTHILPGTLFGRIQIAKFSVSVKHKYVTGYGILDDQGKVVGAINDLDPLVASEVVPRIRSDSEKFEFIVLSLAFHITRFIHEGPDFRYADVTGKSLESPLVVAVMLVGRQGKYMYRIASGRIYLHDWVRANPQFEDILLV